MQDSAVILHSAMILHSDFAQFRGVINGKAGKAAALPKFSDTLSLS